MLLKYCLILLNTYLFQNHCPSLKVLDLSSVMTVGRDCVLVNIEKLQQGCTELRVLRFASSHIRLANSTMTEQVSS